MANEIGKVDDLELAAHIRSGLGLVLGPAPGIHETVARSLAEHFGVSGEGWYYDVAERALDCEGQTAATVRECTKELLLHETAQHVASRANDLLASFTWKCVFSFNLDTDFDIRLRARLSAKPSPWDVVTVVDPSAQPVPRAIPVFHLLGVLQDKEWVCTKGDYREWKTRWPLAVRVLADRLKGDPLICVGIGKTGDLFLDLLSSLGAVMQLERLHLIVPAEDAASITPAGRRQLGPGMRISVYSHDLRALLKACASAGRAGFTAPFQSEKQGPEHAWLDPHRELAVFVNEHLAPSLKAADSLQLRELLFSPDSLRWDPFCYDLDLRRTLETEVLSQIVSEPEQFRGIACVAGVIVGGAASGKTTLLKRIGLELARRQYLVFWMKPWVYQDGLTVARKFMNAVKRQASGRRIIICLDDPPALYGIHPNHLAMAASDAEVQVLLLATVRTSDWETEDSRSKFIGESVTICEERLADDLDDAEWTRLPQFLVALGIAEDEKAAAGKMLQRVAGRDALCAMYYLLPETQHAIKDSIQQEYTRLGRDSLGRLVKQLASTESNLLQRAYGMIAVGETLGANVPLEVLVSALRCDYRSWLETVAGSRVAWGILYEQKDESGESHSYRLRNHVVASSIREVVNGGTLGVTGEYALLGGLLAACDGSSPVYRAFCLRVLVGNPRLARYSESAIAALFERAISALPHEDATLLHHQAIHFRKSGEAERAIKCLERALSAKPYPYSERQEQEEHIHTSYAATILSLLSQKKLSDTEAKEQFQRHIDRARSESFFNPRAIHVQAVYAIKFAGQVQSGSEVDALGLLDRALSDIERYRLLVASPMERFDADHEGRKLYEVRDEILRRFADVEASDRRALELWEKYKSQVGFVLVARALLGSAQTAWKGSAFKRAYDYCTDSIDRVSSSKMVPDVRLLEVALSTYFQWRVRRTSGGAADIDWNVIADLAGAVTAQSQAHPTFKYMLGLALAHLGRWPDAHRVFRELRESRMQSTYLWAKRDLLRGSKGEPRQVQGTVGRGVKDVFLSIPELNTDMPASRKDSWPRNGETALAFVAFSFGGPTAVQDINQ
jgi:tetratricopeptide (TPR) repeat protein